jgi:hypothetical protein
VLTGSNGELVPIPEAKLSLGLRGYRCPVRLARASTPGLAVKLSGGEKDLLFRHMKAR